MSKPRAKAKAATARKTAPTRQARKATAVQGESWVLRCAPGLARVLQAELRFDKLLRHGDRADALWQRNHDLLFLPRLQRAPKPDDLRIAEEVHRCLIYGRYKISDSQIDRLAQQLRNEGIRRRIVVTAEGRHFNRHDLGRWLGKELARRGVRLDEAAEKPLFVFCIEQAYYVCRPARLAAEASGRAERKEEREGSLPPTIAAAMAFLARPDPGDVILDPVCGSGTLLAETAAYAPHATFNGVDTDPKAIKIARRNLGRAEEAHIVRGDGRACDLADGTISLVLANLPFGKQFGDPVENRALYRDLLSEMRRLAKPDGFRAVLLAGDAEMLADAAKATGFREERRVPVRVRGEPATIFVLLAS